MYEVDKRAATETIAKSCKKKIERCELELGKLHGVWVAVVKNLGSNHGRHAADALIAAWVAGKKSKENMVKLARHCLTATPKASAEGLPKVPFDVTYPCRGALQKYAHYKAPSVTSLPPTAPASVAVDPAADWVVDGQSLLDEGEKEAFRQALARRSDRAEGGGSTTVHLDHKSIAAAPGLVPAKAAQSKLVSACAVAADFICERKDSGQPANVTLTLAARRSLYYEKVYQALADGPNWRASVELQGKASVEHMPPEVHRVLMARAGVDISYLWTVAHKDLTGVDAAEKMETLQAGAKGVAIDEVSGEHGLISPQQNQMGGKMVAIGGTDGNGTMGNTSAGVDAAQLSALASISLEKPEHRPKSPLSAGRLQKMQDVHPDLVREAEGKVRSGAGVSGLPELKRQLDGRGQSGDGDDSVSAREETLAAFPT